MPQYSAEEIRVVAEEATRRGTYVAAHAYSAEAIAVAVANGVRSIEHGNLLDAPAAAVMAERDAFLVPTLVTYDAMERRGAELGLAPVAQAKNREVLDAGRTAIRLAREAGVRIGFGTDLMGALDGEQLHGLRLQAEVEGPLALLRAATSVNAELLGRDDLGRIGPGAVADLLVLDADPLRDPSVLWGDPNRRAVFQGGARVVDQAASLALKTPLRDKHAHDGCSVSSQPGSKGLQRDDQGGACRCQRSCVDQQLGEPSERVSSPALIWLRCAHCRVELRDLSPRLGRPRSVQGCARQSPPEPVHRLPCLVVGDDAAVQPTVDYLVALDVVDNASSLVLYVDLHVTLFS